MVDLIRGTPTFDNDAIEDFVIARGDGSPMFLLANVVDDMTMDITHVIRAEEHLPNTPKQQLLLEALGRPPPVWAHVPVVVNEKRQKLSKRRDKVALEEYRDEGYLAAAMRNYLMLLGWAPSGDREIVPWSVIEEEFRLEDVNPSPAFFDVKKLRAFNGEYIRALPDRGVHRGLPALADRPERARGRRSATTRPCSPRSPRSPRPACGAAEMPRYVDFLFLDEAPIDEASWAKAMKDGAGDVLAAVIDASSAAVGRPSPQARRGGGRRRAGPQQGKAQAPVRVAVTGRTVGPPLFESLELLGRERTLERVRAARSRI